MRKLLIAVIAVVTALAVAGIAMAANVYDLTESSTFKKGKGSPSNPVPKGISFDYTVKDSAGPRGAPVKTYKIQFQGLTTKYQNKFPQCSFGRREPECAARHRHAEVRQGEGRRRPHREPRGLRLGSPRRQGPNDVDLYANLQLTLFNIAGGLAIRLDADQPAPTSQNGPFGGPVPTHQAINARHKSVKINGIKSSSLEFDVPEELRHNNGLTITVARTASTIDRKVKKVKIKGKTRKVGVYSAIGCAENGKRIVRVTFVDETDQSSIAKGAGPC